MPKKLGLGGFPHFVFEEFVDSPLLELKAVPSMAQLMSLRKEELRHVLERLDEVDYVVFRLSGENPMEFVQLLRIYGLLNSFMRRSYMVAFWTMDSHHLGLQEKSSQKYFDHIFVAHEPYLNLFSRTDSSFLPCSFSLVPEKRVRQVMRLSHLTTVENAKGVCAPFAAYEWEFRNEQYLFGLIETKNLKLDSFFGTVRGGLEYPNQALVNKLLSFKATLNFSLRDDLNMRNFEALALNRILVTNQVPAHGLLEKWSSNILFVRQDLSNLGEALMHSQHLEPSNFSEDFLREHSIRVRVEEIIKKLANLRLGQDKSVRHTSSVPDCPREPPYSSEIREIAYEPAYLMGRSKHPSLFLIPKLMQFGSFRILDVTRLISIFFSSIARRLLRSSVGRFAIVRAIFTITTLRFTKPDNLSNPW